MCLGVPGRVLSVDVAAGVAICDFWGTERPVRLELLDEPPAVGDYVLDHVGYASRRIDPDDVPELLAMYEELRRDRAVSG